MGMPILISGSSGPHPSQPFTLPTANGVDQPNAEARSERRKKAEGLLARHLSE
jgi:hypothetical protein